MSPKYTIGLDYGTNSVRALIVDTANGREAGTAVWDYEHGTAGVILSRDPNLARQHPADYVKGAEVAIKRALAEAKKNVRGFQPEQVVGIGVDTTGSTPLPVDQTRPATGLRQEICQKSGGHGLVVEGSHRRGGSGGNHRVGRKNPPALSGEMRRRLFQRMVFQQDSALPARPRRRFLRRRNSWVELADYVPAALTDTEAPQKLTVGICAAGHKAMFNESWGGYPDAEFLSELDPKLGRTAPPVVPTCPHGCRSRRRI